MPPLALEMSINLTKGIENCSPEQVRLHARVSGPPGAAIH